MKTYFLMATLLVGSLQATIKISEQQKETFFRAIALNSHQQIQQFFERIHASDGFNTVVAYANLRNPDNQTPLHLARGREMFETLLNNGADIGAKDNQNRLSLVAICMVNETNVSLSILGHLPQFLSLSQCFAHAKIGNSEGRLL